ncbi:MAG: RNA-directed DNA polymerase [Chlamydiales bacterium]
MANIFAHRVLDEWVEKMIQPYCRGEVRLFRYADDGIICCRYASDAKRVREGLRKRLEKYNLKLNEEKTRMVSFSKAQLDRGVKQGVFDFLGFTFYLGRSKSGKVIPKLKTSGKTIRNKLKRVGEWMKANRSKMKTSKLWKGFCVKLRGHVQYYGVSFNDKAVHSFLHGATRICFKWLNRRSQKKSLTWEKFSRFLDANPLPLNKVYHPLF